MKKIILTAFVFTVSVTGLLAQARQFQWKHTAQDTIDWNTTVIIDDHTYMMVPYDSKYFQIGSPAREYSYVIPMSHDSASILIEPDVNGVEFMRYRQRLALPMMNDVIDVGHEIK